MGIRNVLTNPPSIPDCNEEGKTMVVYRFPRQLDPELDKVVLAQLAANGINYDITTTGDCYPFPVVILTKTNTHSLVD